MKMLFFSFIVILLIGAGCGDCLHCGEGSGSISRYSIINALNSPIFLIIYGKNIQTKYIINPMDTTRNWDVVNLPAQLESKFFTLDQNNYGNSFPYDSDSILVKIDDKVVRRFFENDDHTNPDWEDWNTSIYNEASYVVIPPKELPPNESTSGSSDNVHLFYYSLDSINLNLN